MKNLIQIEEEFWRTPINVKRKYLNGRFGQIHYRITQPENQTNIPLLCFHLSPNSSKVYDKFISSMGTERTCIAPDTPGFGDSDPPSKQPTIDDYAAAMGDLIDILKLDKIHLIGYHTGCKIALVLARQRPKIVSKIILISAPIYTEAELTNQKKMMGHPKVTEAKDDGSHLTNHWKNNLKWADQLAPLIFSHRQIAEYLKAGENSWWGHNAAFSVKHQDLLPSIKHPVLILCPKDDLYEPTLRAKNYLLNGEIIELKDCAHGFLDFRTDRVCKIVNKFLNKKNINLQTTPSIPIPQKINANKKNITKAFLDKQIGQLHYRITKPKKSTKVPLLCMHMSPNSGKIYENLMNLLGTDRICIAPDTPGFGESDAPLSAPSIQDYAQSMSDLIDTMKYETIDVIGYHTGSITCIALALLKPKLVRRIIQISCPVYTAEEREERKFKYGSKPLDPNGKHLTDKWKHMIPFYGKHVPRWIIKRNFAEGLRGGPFSHWGHQAAFNYDLSTALQKINNPVLVVNPNDDIVEQTPRGINLIKNSILYEIKDHGHGFLDIITKDFSERLRLFLDSDDPR